MAYYHRLLKIPGTSTEAAGMLIRQLNVCQAAIVDMYQLGDSLKPQDDMPTTFLIRFESKDNLARFHSLGYNTYMTNKTQINRTTT